MTRRNLRPAGLFALKVTKVLVAGKITNTELVRRLRDRGYQESRQAVVNYVAGKRGPEGEMSKLGGLWNCRMTGSSRCTEAPL
jgi:hypothetical protein